jgi:hypothetical protein
VVELICRDANSKSAAAGVWRKSSKIIPHPMYRYTYWWENTYDDLALVEVPKNNYFYEYLSF